MEEEFKKRIIMPEPKVSSEEPEEEIQEHPNARHLDNILMNQDENMSISNSTLENILVKLDESNEDTNNLLEHGLLISDELVTEIKNLKEVIKQDKEWQIKLTLE